MESQSAVPRPPLFPRRPNKANPRPKPGSANELPALLTNAAGSAHPVRPGCPADHPDPASGSAGPASVGRPAARLADRLGPVAATAGPAFGSGSVGSGCSWGALLMSRLVRRLERAPCGASSAFSGIILPAIVGNHPMRWPPSLGNRHAEGANALLERMAVPRIRAERRGKLTCAAYWL